MATNVLGLMGYVQEQGELGRQRGEQNAFARLTPAALQGDPMAQQQQVAINPTAAAQVRSAGDDQAMRLRGAAKYMQQAITSGDPRRVQGAWSHVGPYLGRLTGKAVPEQWDPAMQPAMEQALASTAYLEKAAQGEQYTLTPGSRRYDASGNLVAEAPQLPVSSQIVSVPDGSGGTVQMEYNPRTGEWRQPTYGAGSASVGPQPTQPSPQRAGIGTDHISNFQNLAQQFPGTRVTSTNRTPERNAQVGGVANSQHLRGTAGDFVVPQADRPAFIAQAQSMGYEAIDEGDHIHLELPPGRQVAQAGGAPRLGYTPPKGPSDIELERLRLAQEANERAAAAAAQAARGNAPAGFRFRDDGTLEPIPGGPKPAGATASEGERKAATLLRRLEGSLSQLEMAVVDDPNAAAPTVAGSVAGSLPFVGDAARNAMNSSERQRVEAAQLDILDAALTLGTGAAYTREQLEGYRRSFFPQLGDTEDNIRDKQARLQNVIESARIAAGRAAPGVQGPPDPQSPRRIANAADYDALPSGAVYIAPDGSQRRKR